MSRRGGYSVIAVAYLLGGSSLLLLGLFLLLGPISGIELGLPFGVALAWDATLCLAFVVQHSVMVRRSFQRRLERLIPAHLHGASFTVVSGAVLLLMILLWQSTGSTLASAAGPLRLLLRGTVILAVLGFVWGVRALGSFDGFGAGSILTELRGRTSGVTPLVVRGPYRWVRHPLYFFFMVLLWSAPDLTPERLLLDVCWTAWIFAGSMLEERDLVSDFGDSYREYQQQVPMLLPYRLPVPS